MLGEERFLTAREYEVLEHVADGATNRVIARRLSLSEDTVKTHMRGVLRKLRVSSRGAAVARYLRQLPNSAPRVAVDAGIDPLTGSRRRDPLAFRRARGGEEAG